MTLPPQPLTGGTDGTVTDDAYQTYLEKMESYTFHAMGCLSANPTITALFTSFCKRMREDVGKKFQVVLFRTLADYEGVVSVKNSVAKQEDTTTTVGTAVVNQAVLQKADDVTALIPWVTGVIAGTAVNKSATNMKYDGAYQIDTDYTQTELENGIKNYAEDGLVTAQVVKNAMFAMADETNAKFESMPMTWGQVFTMAGNIAIKALEPLLQGINWLANHISIIGPMVLGVGAAFVVFQIAAHWTQIAAAATAIYHGVVGFLSIGFGVLTGNATAAAAAVQMFNAALLANPIVWVVMLIVVLIGALYAGVAAYNKFTNAGVSATGIIAAAFAVLFAFLINSVIIPLQHAFAMIANFIGNVFHNPVAAVKVLFYDMCLTVMGYIKNLAQGIENLINKIPGVTVNITSGLDNFYAGLQQAQQKVKDESGWVEYMHQWDFIAYTGAATAGYQFGKGIVDKVSHAFGMGGIDTSAFGNALDGVHQNTGNTAGNTAAMKDNMDISKEDLRYMRDIAEREAINRYTTAEIKVEQKNENHITKDVDIDGILDIWANDFAQKLDISAEGVYA